MSGSLNDKLNVGVVGLGGRGLYFCRLYDRHPKTRIHSVCDLRGYTSIDEMYADPDLDAVLVATYDHQHTKPTVKALDAGKHTMVEKPLAQTVEDCQAMIAAARRSKAIFMVGLELRHCVLFERMKELLDDGAIGEVKVGVGFDNVSVGGNYFYHGRSRHKDFIVSLLIQKACHSLDLLNWFMGGRPVRVFSLGGLDYYGGNEPEDKRCRDCEKQEKCPFRVNYKKFVMDYGEAVEVSDLCVWGRDCTTLDNSELAIQYDNGSKATFTECHFTPEYSREFTLIGTEGKMYGHYNNEGFFVIRVNHRFTDHVDEYQPRHTGGSHGGGDLRMQEEFIECCVTQRKPRSGVLAAYDSTVLAICAEKSIDTGQPVDIPLV